MDGGFLDTNVIIRHLTRDNPRQGERSRRIFEQLDEGTLTLETCEGVIVEAVQVLSSRRLYALPRHEITEYLTQLLSMRGLRILSKQTYLRALDLYATSRLDFVDCLLVAHAERTSSATIVSFDHEFDRVATVRRQEP